MDKDAVISECGRYRHRLSRFWKDEGLVFGFFGVNPSTADASIDDATVRKWVGFTDRNGGKGFIVGNVFDFRATNVKELLVPDMAASLVNEFYLREIIKDSDVLVPCWGNSSKVHKQLRRSFDDVMSLILSAGKPVMCFGLTKSGDPKHPLMLGYNTPLIPFDVNYDAAQDMQLTPPPEA